MRMRWLILVLLILAALTGVGVWVSRRSAPAPSKIPPETPARITIAQAGDFFLYAPLYVAVDAGYLRRQGLEVSIVSTGGDDKTWAAVTSGSAMFGVADPTFVAVSGLRGEPGRAIAQIVNGVPFWGVTFRADVPEIKTGQGLKGYWVATFPEPSTAFALQRKMFVDYGLPTQIRQGAFGTLMAMLDAKQADIALELEPNVSEAVSRGARVVYSMPELYGDFAMTGLTVTPQVLRTSPELVSKVLCGLQLALDHIHQHTDESLALLLRRFSGLNTTVAAEALRRVVEQGIVPRDLAIGSAAWSSAVQLRVDSKQLPPGTYDDYRDDALALAAAAAPGCHL